MRRLDEFMAIAKAITDSTPPSSLDTRPVAGLIERCVGAGFTSDEANALFAYAVEQGWIEKRPGGRMGAGVFRVTGRSQR